MPRAKQASSQTDIPKKPNARKAYTQRAKEQAKESIQTLIDANWAQVQKCIPSANRLLEQSPEITDEIVSLIILGASVKESVLATGVAWATHSQWMVKARDGIEPYATYSTRIQLAKAVFQARTAIAINQIAVGNLKGDSKPLQWILERRAGDDYYIKQDNQTNVNVKLPEGLSLEDALSLARGNK